MREYTKSVFYKKNKKPIFYSIEYSLSFNNGLSDFMTININ